MLEIKPLITVILPIYNVEKYLHKCINSIVTQTYSNFELLLIDDGSTDQSFKICEGYQKKDKRIRCIHQENKGVSAARNRGLELSTGSYISFIDPDDYVRNDYLELLLDALLKNDADISICDYVMLYKDGVEKKKNSDNGTFSAEEAIEIVCYQKQFDSNPVARLYKKTLFDNVRFKFGILYEDTEIFYQLYHKCDKITFINDHCYYYFQRHGSTMNSKFDRRKLVLIEIMDDFLKFIDCNYPNLHDAAVSRCVYSYCYLLNMIQSEQNLEEVRKKLIDLILEHRKTVLGNPKENKKNKIAVLLLSINIHLYKLIFYLYKKSQQRSV